MMGNEFKISDEDLAKLTYKIDIIMAKPEISTDFKIICWSEEFDGKKKDAIKCAKELQKEWTAEFFTITKL